MADFDWPEDIVPYVAAFGLEAHSGGSESPFTRQTKTYGLSAPRWICRISIRAGDNSTKWPGDVGGWGQRVEAFIASLRGRQNRVRLWDFRRPGSALAINNEFIIAGETVVILDDEVDVGSYIGGDGRPHIVTAVEAHGSGYAVTVEPPFRADVEAGAATFEEVGAYFRLTSDSAAVVDSEVGRLTVYSLELIEDLGGAEVGEALGTIVVDNSAGDEIEEGYQVGVFLPWKAGLEEDFRNLRIFDERGRELPFFLEPTNTLAGEQAAVFFRAPTIEQRTHYFYYDGGATSFQSSGARVFDFFDDFQSEEISERKWTVTVDAEAAVHTQPKLVPRPLWSKTLDRAQAFCFTPYGIALTNWDPDAAGMPGYLYTVDRETGETLQGPVTTVSHPWTQFYVPERDYIVVCGAPGPNAEPDGSAWVHDASDLSFVGKIQMEATDSDLPVYLMYFGPNKLLRLADDFLSYIEYSIDWDDLSFDDGTVYGIDTNGDLDLQPGIAQGVAYNPREHQVYYIGWSNDGLDRFIYRYDLSTGTAQMSARWRQIPGDPDFEPQEPEGIAFDEDGNLYFGGLDNDIDQFTLFEANLTWANRPERQRLPVSDTGRPFGNGYGAFLFVPEVDGNKRVVLHSKTPLTGATRVIFGVHGMGDPDNPGAAGNYPQIGISSSEAYPNEVSAAQFMRTASGDDASTIRLRRAATGETTTATAAALSDTLGRPAMFEIQWDGTEIRFRHNGAAVEEYTDIVPALGVASTMSERLAVYSGVTGVRGVGMLVYYVARARTVPAGTSRPAVSAY